MKILMKIRFDGTGYCGFQAQANGKAVQNVLTDAFSSFLGFPCDITGCSRTDSGVHALGFCATVSPRNHPLTDDWCPIPPEKLHRAANIHLPSDIAVMAAAPVPDDFHPRYDVVSKEYEYRIYDSSYRDPFLLNRAYHSVRPIGSAGIERMQRAASAFVGTHTFSAYMATGSKIEDTTRTVLSASVERSLAGEFSFRVRADGFLYNMVRIMTGTLLECGYGARSYEDVLRSLESGARTDAGFTAPPDGLYLSDVTYNRPIRWLCE